MFSLLYSEFSLAQFSSCTIWSFLSSQKTSYVIILIMELTFLTFVGEEIISCLVESNAQSNTKES